MNKYFEKSEDGFIIAYKKKKFYKDEGEGYLKILTPSIYNAKFYPSSQESLLIEKIEGWNDEVEEEVYSLIKVRRTIIIESEEML